MRQQDVAEWKSSPALAHKFITNINIIKSKTYYHSPTTAGLETFLRPVGTEGSVG